MAKLAFSINGKDIACEADDSTLLVELLREKIGLTGTHVGCDTTQCGACTVILDGRSVKSCTVLAAQASGSVVTTVEGLEQDGRLHPVQEAFIACHGLQCGFCTPGMIMAAVHFLREEPPDLTDEAIKRALEGNICRCTGYVNIMAAVRSAACRMYPRLKSQLKSRLSEEGA